MATKALVFDPGKFELTDFRAERESTEYAACVFKLDSASICFRVAKTTPRKVGQFVTLWKRYGTGAIQPFDASDGFDFYVISTRTTAGFGQFVFPRSVLLEQGVLSHDGWGGKRAIRIYPPWVVTLSRQAQRTQRWQTPHFLEIPGEGGSVDLDRLKLLYGRPPAGTSKGTATRSK
ncbi:MepB family protein [Noviluteimonas gilva]|uniref:MepB family protein n=1 Tax=Noviluteimonas gilva TaxID=2682097 RepID=UPI0018D25370